jgi:hypothetical protein
MACGGELQLMIKLKTRLEWINRQLHWIWVTWFQLVGSLCYILFLRKQFVGGSHALGFCSMRHSAIYEQEVDFQEHCARKFWVVWSHGPWPKEHVRAYKTFLARFGFYVPRPNYQYVLEWLEEASLKL